MTFANYKYTERVVLHISTPDDANTVNSTIIDIHSDYKIPFFDDAGYRYGYDDGYMNNMTAKAVRELETKYPDRKNVFISIFRTYAKTEPIINSIRAKLQSVLGLGRRSHNKAPKKFRLAFTFPTMDNILVLIEKKDPYYHLMGTRMNKKNLMMALGRIIYWSCFNKDSTKMLEYIFKVINMPENVSYVLENRCPYWFFDMETRQKMEVRLQTKVIGDEMCALEISDNIWAPITFKELDIFVNYFHHGHNRTRKYRFLSPKKLWVILLGNEPTQAQVNLMTEFLCQNRTQDIVEERAKSLMLEVVNNYSDRIKLLNHEDLFNVRAKKPCVMVVKGQLTDWIIVNTTYKSDIQKVKTYAYIDNDWLAHLGEDATNMQRRMLGDHRGKLFQNGKLKGPICIDNIHINSSIGDQYVARAYALLNDKTTVKMVSTISRYLPSDMLETSCPETIIDSRRMDWSNLDNEEWEKIGDR